MSQDGKIGKNSNSDNDDSVIFTNYWNVDSTQDTSYYNSSPLSTHSNFTQQLTTHCKFILKLIGNSIFIF